MLCSIDSMFLSQGHAQNCPSFCYGDTEESDERVDPSNSNVLDACITHLRNEQVFMPAPTGRETWKEIVGGSDGSRSAKAVPDLQVLEDFRTFQTNEIMQRKM